MSAKKKENKPLLNAYYMSDIIKYFHASQIYTQNYV